MAVYSVIIPTAIDMIATINEIVLRLLVEIISMLDDIKYPNQNNINYLTIFPKN